MKVLILKPSSLGDVVQAIPLLRLLKQHRPDAEVHWWLGTDLLPLLADDPGITRLLPFERRGWLAPSYWLNWFAQLRELRAARFDWVIDLQGLARSGVMAWLANGRFTLGLAHGHEGAQLFYDRVVPRPTDRPHAVDWYLAAARALGIPVTDDFDWLPARLEVAERVLARWPLDTGRWIAVNPGARWENKRWPAAHFADLVRLLAAQQPELRFAVLGGSGDWSVAESICRAAPDRTLNLAGRTSLPELIECLRRCELLVTNDTGPMHLAAALRRPVVALFGPTSPAHTGPYGQESLALRHPLPCAPCLKSRCHWSQPKECLTAIAPARVAAEVQRRLAA